MIGVAGNKTCGNTDCKFCQRLNVLSSRKMSLFVQHVVIGKGYVKIWLGHNPVLGFRNGSFLSCIIRKFWGREGLKLDVFFFEKHAEG